MVQNNLIISVLIFDSMLTITIFLYIFLLISYLKSAKDIEWTYVCFIDWCEYLLIVGEEYVGLNNSSIEEVCEKED